MMVKYTEISIPINNTESIKGDLHLVSRSSSLAIFAHGSGSSRFSSRNKVVAQVLQQGGISTLLFDLLTQEEDRIDQVTREFRFDIPLLAHRLMAVTEWAQSDEQTAIFKLGYFGSSTGAAAALIAAAQLGNAISAVVSRGGRTDLAGTTVEQVQAPTLLIVGELDYDVIQLNEATYKKLQCTKKIYIVPQATHLFEEPGTLEDVAQAALTWFQTYLR